VEKFQNHMCTRLKVEVEVEAELSKIMRRLKIQQPIVLSIDEYGSLPQERLDSH